MSMKKKVFIFSYAILLSGLLFSVEAKACSCIESYSPLLQRLTTADAVFVGDVIYAADVPKKTVRKKDLGYDMIVTFKVSKNYKGLSDSAKTVSLNTNYRSNSCGYWVDGKPKPQIGQKWLVFAYRSQGSPQLRLTGTCDKSRVLSGKTELKEIDEILSATDQLPIAALSIDHNYEMLEAVKATITGNGISRTEVTKDGMIKFDRLPPGKYQITATVLGDLRLVQTTIYPVDLTRSVGEVDGKVYTQFTYSIEIKPGDYSYNEIRTINK